MIEAIGKKMKDQTMLIARLIGSVTGTKFEDDSEEDEDEAETPVTAPEFDYKAILARQTAHLQGN